MNELYAFLDRGENFFGFIVLIIVVFAGIRECIKAARGDRRSETKSNKQRLND